ncbi:MAG: beta-N-acetylhexosaminidase [Bacteroidales bacterium]|nr:beta-N-acetylhexosaminidase [Bacteroidales bacterium]
MKLKQLFVAAWAVCALPGQAQNPLPVIPLPAQMERAEGVFQFEAKTKVAADDYPGDSIAMVLDRFAQKFQTTTGLKLTRAKAKKAALYLKLDPTMGCEAYRLNVTPQRVVVEAARPAGFFYALQTLQQLLPSRSVMAGVQADGCCAGKWTLPAVSISDEPRFGWRGFMLDEGRHFYGKEEIKKLLDVMAAYKLNRFHWHLTEDQGWRIEIKKYPRLTEVGAWRDSKVLGWGEVKPDGQRYGGFYTQDDAREIVQYARERFIEIVPEVDIPGHSQAAVASYPEFLSCDPQNKHEVWLWQGVSADVINVSNPKAVQFAKDVVDELTEVFPFGYLHLGGDECPTQKWEQNADCQLQLKEIGSTNYRDLQINFYRQLQQHIAAKPAAKQRQLIFWNEVLHGNTAPLGKDITIMAWVGADGAARDAAERGLYTILSPQIPYYINRRQSPLPTEPRSQGNGSETVEAVYNYVPMNGIPAGLQPRYMGVQANFWTEWVEDASTVQYLMFPRLAAVAEAGWTPQGLRSYNDFLQRLQSESEYYRLRGVNYGKHVFK